jgi:dTDP-4-amino-4,6-dideoxygalactose transaminase
MQGAILRVKLRHLEAWNEARRTHAAQYKERLAGGSVRSPMEMPYARHVYHVYAIRSLKRDHLQKSLQAKGIQSGIHYPIPVHLQKAYEDLGYKKDDFPQAEEVSKEVLSIPIFAELTEAQISVILKEIYE